MKDHLIACAILTGVMVAFVAGWVTGYQAGRAGVQQPPVPVPVMPKTDD